MSPFTELLHPPTPRTFKVLAVAYHFRKTAKVCASFGAYLAIICLVVISSNLAAIACDDHACTCDTFYVAQAEMQIGGDSPCDHCVVFQFAIRTCDKTVDSARLTIQFDPACSAAGQTIYDADCNAIGTVPGNSNFQLKSYTTIDTCTTYLSFYFKVCGLSSECAYSTIHFQCKTWHPDLSFCNFGGTLTVGCVDCIFNRGDTLTPSFNFFPNPSHEGKISAQFESREEGPVTMDLFSNDGRLLESKQLSVHMGEHFLVTFDLLKRGVYYCRFRQLHSVWTRMIPVVE